MVQVADRTYRIVRLNPGVYEAVRILDDVVVGSFSTTPPISVSAYCIEPGLMQVIARAAIHGARTSWVGRLVNVRKADEPSTSSELPRAQPDGDLSAHARRS